MKRWKLLFMLICGFILGVAMGTAIAQEHQIHTATIDRIESEIAVLEIAYGPNNIEFVNVPSEWIFGEVTEGDKVKMILFSEVQ